MTRNRELNSRNEPACRIRVGTSLALIPARGGSKSIPLKNLVRIGEWPLLSYVAAAINASRDHLDFTLCSTDHPEIAGLSERHGIEVDHRPYQLCSDDIAVADVIRDVLSRFEARKDFVPEFVVLFQPTNPFVLPEHVAGVVRAIRCDPSVMSAQTVTEIEHNLHAFNQRVIENGRVRFYFSNLREASYNKQRKPGMFRFGNLVATRSAALLSGASCFAEPSIALEIPRFHALDIDVPDDLAFANYLVSHDLVKLPRVIHLHLARPARNESRKKFADPRTSPTRA